MDLENKEPICLGGFNDLIKMRDGWMVYNKNDVYIGKSIKEYGEWSQGEIDICKQILSPSDVVIEVGSNIGSHTLALAKTVNKGAVFAFEPQNVIFQNLCSNIAMNSITNCFCYQNAVSDKSKEQCFIPNLDYTRQNNFGGISISNEKNDFSLPVEVVTLDDKFNNLNRLKILKMDIEGNELNALIGGYNLIKRTKPLLYLENDRLDKSKELIEFIFSFGYRIFWHISKLYNKDNFFKNSTNVFGNIASLNMIAFDKELDIKINLPEVKDSSFHPLRK